MSASVKCNLFFSGPPPFALLLLLGFCSACTGTFALEEVKVDSKTLVIEQAMIGQLNAPGVDPDTLWRLEAQYLDAEGNVLSDTRFEVVFVQGEWRSELAPMQVSPGYHLIRDPGEFGDGAPDLSSALRIAPAWLAMRMTQRIVPLNELQPLAVPAGARALRARLLEVCPLRVRRMRQVNWISRGDVIALRHVKEEMRWREYQPKGRCRALP